MMDVDTRLALKGNISLIDQAVGPLTQLANSLNTAADRELLLPVSEMDTSGREMAHELVRAAKEMWDMIVTLNQAKEWLKEL